MQLKPPRKNCIFHVQSMYAPKVYKLPLTHVPSQEPLSLFLMGWNAIIIYVAMQTRSLDSLSSSAHKRSQRPILLFQKYLLNCLSLFILIVITPVQFYFYFCLY